ncbi:MAG: hypothetical protein WD491_02590 [Balneolales bacterium]
MAFKVYSRLRQAVEPFESFLVTDSEAITEGEALVFASGRLTKCGATATPEAIAIEDVTAGTDQLCTVIRVTEDTEFSTTSTATVAASKVGDAVTLHTDGLRVTGTTTSGVFTISSTDGATTNSNVTGYFRR